MKIPFSLFPNDKKVGNQPDFRSVFRHPIVITEPGEYKIAGWKQISKDGQSFISCSLEKVEAGQPQGPTREQNIAEIQRVRQALEEGQGLMQAPKKTYQPSTPPPYAEDDSLPF